MSFLLRVHARNANETTHRKQAPELHLGALASRRRVSKKATHQLAGGTPALPGTAHANSTAYFDSISPSRGGNSNVILPLSSITRYAGNGLPALEMNLSISSVLRAAKSFCTWAGSMGCCKISRLILNLHGRASACDFSQR